ncbi:Ger(x)C family spore germination protein [Paenibacillus donghaensis]|uniref:Uncharacterized protein n=1 Tax=Paenibacillus donghaensis TaxID=414771 RepID=A0A2Z2KH07_9BACL|nr:Ger(x)C family spore germination protein [Paenibacillus donghaensis]ASA25504.1 hypothetical protein B9T62_35105 [Paenibacillus donghaensis]
MSSYRPSLLLLSLLLLLPGVSGCWNYAEVDDMSIVAGVAIDKDKKAGKLLITTELFDTKGELQQNQASFKIVTLSGDTMFDIVRNMISMTGKKLFWSHSKAIIISEEIAREGVIRVIDWYSRDTETRSDVYIYVSGEPTARALLNMNGTSEMIMSFELAQMMRNETHVSTAPVVEIWDFIDKLESEGKSAMAPIVSIYANNKQKNERVYGTAIFSNDKMVGIVSGEESKYLLFAKDDVKGGVLVVGNESGVPTYSLEILKSATKLKPRWVNGRLQMHVQVLVETGLDEVMTAEGFNNFSDVQSIEQRGEEEVRQRIAAIIQKLQQEYHADVLGYGEIVHQEMPKLWKKISKNWPQEFAEMDIEVEAKVVIRSSAKTSRSIKMGD